MYKGVMYLDISQLITTNTSDQDIGPNSHTNVLVKSTRTKNPVYTTEKLSGWKSVNAKPRVPNYNGKASKKTNLPLCLQCFTVYLHIMHNLIY